VKFAIFWLFFENKMPYGAYMTGNNQDLVIFTPQK